MIDTLADGVRQVNQAFIESPELDINQYRALISEYLIDKLIDELLKAKGLNNEYPNLGHFGFYSDPNIGYTGYVQLGDKVLFFAPTKAIIMDKAHDNISPVGNL